MFKLFCLIKFKQQALLNPTQTDPLTYYKSNLILLNNHLSFNVF